MSKLLISCCCDCKLGSLGKEQKVCVQFNFILEGIWQTTIAEHILVEEGVLWGQTSSNLGAALQEITEKNVYTFFSVINTYKFSK